MRAPPISIPLAVVILTVAACLPTGARGASGATATATIPIVFKSVTLSTGKLTYGKCSGGYSSGAGLGFPNGTCTTGSFTVANGQAPSTIVAAGANAIAADGGSGWSLCAGLGSPACAASAPGANQFSEQEGTVQLGLSPACDASFAVMPCGSAGPGQTATESLKLVGPRTSTDQSSSFTTQITWTAS